MSNEINPNVTPSETTTYYVKALTANGCFGEAELIVNINEPQNLVLDEATVCETDLPYNLNLLNTNAISGQWSGTNVSGDSFDPDNQNGAIVLTFTPTDLCTAAETTTITVNAADNLLLDVATLCASDDALDLMSLVDPLHPTGTWSGPGVSNDFFDPSNFNGVVNVTFNSDDLCVNNGTTQLTVLPSPAFSVDVPVSVCEGSNIDLNDYVNLSGALQLEFYSNLPATGPNLINNIVNNLTVTSTYYVKAIDANNCFSILPLTINVNPGGDPLLASDVICQNSGLYNLDVLLDPLVGPGIWSGPGVTGNNFDPTTANGFVDIFFNPTNVCYENAQTIIEVVVPQDISLTTTNICSNASLFDLDALADPSFVNGTWTGTGVNNNLFNPSGLNGSYALLFIPDDFCVNAASTSIGVTPSQIPQLTNTTICETDGIFDLTLLMDPNFSSGIWNGPGISGTNFDPSGLTGVNELYFISDQNCVEQATSLITVKALATPLLSFIDLCQNSGSFDLNFLTDPQFTTGTWSGQGVVNNVFYTDNLEGQIELNFLSNQNCVLEATTFANVALPPTAGNIKTTCDPTSSTYTVSFDIIGGDGSSYIVNGVASSTSFISSPFTSNMPYSFSIDDNNSCGPFLLSGNVNCLCTNNAGTMVVTTQNSKVCSANIASANYNYDGITGPGDTLIFVLHTSSGNSLGTILATSNLPQFSFPPSGELNKTYYISAVTGNLVNGAIDTGDPCLSVSSGAPVSFYAPTYTSTTTNEICENNCIQLIPNANGQAPYSVVYDIYDHLTFISKDTFFINQNSDTIFICPADWAIQPDQLILNAIAFSDAQCEVALNTMQDTIHIYKNKETTFTPVLCSGKQFILNGKIYDENNVSGIQQLQTLFGCDSLLTVNASFLPVSKIDFQKVYCKGSSITINGTVYDENKTNGTEVILNGSANGCDSIVTIALQFKDAVTNELKLQLCKEEKIVVNGKTYDFNLPSGQEIIKNGSAQGCDSIINVQLTFEQEKLAIFNQTLCYNEIITVNGKNYSVNNPTGTEILKNAASGGCDSLVQIDLKFLPAVSTNYQPLLCYGESISINGTTYDALHNQGTEVIKNGSALGCDSTVNVNVNFHNISQSLYAAEICKNDQIGIQGTTYNANNLSGVEIISNGSSYGCDSFINVSLTLLPEPQGYIDVTVCQNENITINGVVYNESHPSGTDTLEKASFMGCDSILTVSLSFLPTASSQDTYYLTVGDSILINGTYYSERKSEGIEVFTSSISGCDSISYITIKTGKPILTLDYEIITPSCVQDSSTIIIHNLFGSRNYELEWQGTRIPVTSFPYSIKNVKAGDYVLKIYAAFEAYLEENISIDESKPFELKLSQTEFEILPNQELQLDCILNEDVEIFSWSPAAYLSCADCKIPSTFGVDTTTIFTITAFNADGCKDENSIVVRITKVKPTIVVSNIIISGSSGDNGNVKVVSTGNAIVKSMAIYDRWGNKVYETNENLVTNPSASWNGKINGSKVSSGVYVYYLKVEEDGASYIIKGDVTVL